MLSKTLDPKNTYKLFSDEDICLLVDMSYAEDFSNQEKIHLRFQLQHYELDAPNHPKLKMCHRLLIYTKESLKLKNQQFIHLLTG
jgi:hypothetical protein